MASAKCKELFPHEDTVNLNKFFGDPTGRNGQVDSKWYKENIVKIKSMVKPGGHLILGLYHPWGKLAKKLFQIDYKNKIL